MAKLFKNDIIDKLVNFGKWFFFFSENDHWFPKGCFYSVKLPFSISKINTDTNLQEDSSQLCPVHATGVTNIQLLGERERGGEEKNKTRREHREYGGTTNPVQQSQLERWFNGRTVQVMKYIKLQFC